MRRLLPPLALLFALVWAGQAHAAIAPDGPRLAFTKFTSTIEDVFISETVDAMTMGPLGEQRQVLLGDSVDSPVSGAFVSSWSPDGAALAVTVGTLDGTEVFAVAPDGSNLRPVTRDGLSSSGIYSADGRSIYLSRGLNFGEESRRAPIWAMPVDGGAAQRITPRRNGVLDIPTSASSDGKWLAFTRIHCEPERRSFFRRCGNSAWLLQLDTGNEVRLARRAVDPAFSPDGSQIAYSSYRRKRKSPERFSDLKVIELATGEIRRLTRTRQLAEFHPSWDPSGQQIAFSSSNGTASSLVTTNSDGSCRHVIAPRIKRGSGRVVSFLNPVWQPGPGRGAGRIAC